MISIYPSILPWSNNDNVPMSLSPSPPPPLSSENAHTVHFRDCAAGMAESMCLVIFLTKNDCQIRLPQLVSLDTFLAYDALIYAWNHLIHPTQWLPAGCRHPLETATVRRKNLTLNQNFVLYWINLSYSMQLCSHFRYTNNISQKDACLPLTEAFLPIFFSCEWPIFGHATLARQSQGHTWRNNNLNIYMVNVIS